MHEVAETRGRTERIRHDIILVGSGHRDDQRRCARCRVLSEIRMLRHSSVTKITDTGAPLWESYEQRGKSRTAMSTIEEVRTAEKKVQKVLDALRKADARDAEGLSAELTKATDEYAKAVRELRSG